MSNERSLVVLLTVVLAAAALSSCDTAPGNEPELGTPPSAPAIVSISPGPGYVDIAWQHDGDDTSAYSIYRAEAIVSESSTEVLQDVDGVVEVGAIVRRAADAPSADAWVRVDDTDGEARAHRDSSAVTGTSYFYAVTARNLDGLESPLPAPSGSSIRAEPIGNPTGTNPDPERYLAVIVRNFIGNAVVGAKVSLNLISTDGTGSGIGLHNILTDANGVALAHDFGTSWPAPGTFNVGILVDYDGLSPGATFTTYENIELPGTIDIDPSSAILTPVPVSLADAGQPIEGYIQLVPTFAGTRHVSTGFLRLSTGTLRMTPGAYEVLVTQPEGPNAFSLSVPLTVAADPSFLFDAAEVSDAITLYTPFDLTGLSQPLERFYVVASRKDNWTQGMFIPILSQTSRHSPGRYQIRATARLMDDNGTPWTYSLQPSLTADAIDLEMTTPGASFVHHFGGPAELRLVHNPVQQWSSPLQAAYVPGDRVFVAGRFFDANDNHLTPFSNHEVPCGLTIHDPNGPQVLQTTGNWYQLLRSGSQPASYLVNDLSPKGVYTAEALCDLGPYTNSITGSTTFIVE